MHPDQRIFTESLLDVSQTNSFVRVLARSPCFTSQSLFLTIEAYASIEAAIDGPT